MNNMRFVFHTVRAVAILTILSAVLPSLTWAGQDSWIDSAASEYSFASMQYDSVMLQKTIELINQHPLAEQQSPRALLLRGLIFWRLELIAYCLDKKTGMNRYGEMAIAALNEAEKAGADQCLTASHKALASQLLAGQGMRKGVIYGPRAGAELKKAQKANPLGYYPQLVEAINANQAPSFAGGNPKKAVALLEKMAVIFPDSIDVKIHLADAYLHVGRKEDGRNLLVSIVNSYPSNLLAYKIAGKLALKQ
jgi:hypothetical protein